MKSICTKIGAILIALIGTLFTNSLKHANADYPPHDRRMALYACDCEDQWGQSYAGTAWSCQSPGNECYTSEGCICPC